MATRSERIATRVSSLRARERQAFSERAATACGGWRPNRRDRRGRWLRCRAPGRRNRPGNYRSRCDSLRRQDLHRHQRMRSSSRRKSHPQMWSVDDAFRDLVHIQLDFMPRHIETDGVSCGADARRERFKCPRDHALDPPARTDFLPGSFSERSRLRASRVRSRR